MSKVTNLKRLVIEDFDKDDQRVVEKIAFSYNPLMEQLTSAFNKGIEFDNLNQQYIQITITVDAFGTPTILLQIKYELKTKLKGMQVISHQNLTDDTFPTSQPYISYTANGNLINIDNITGLPANKKFVLSVILYG